MEMKKEQQEFTFQYGSTLIINKVYRLGNVQAFTFQYGSTLILRALFSLSFLITFTFQYGSTLIKSIEI